jgi:hypothetical protein
MNLGIELASSVQTRANKLLCNIRFYQVHFMYSVRLVIVFVYKCANINKKKGFVFINDFSLFKVLSRVFLNTHTENKIRILEFILSESNK